MPLLLPSGTKRISRPNTRSWPLTSREVHRLSIKHLTIPIPAPLAQKTNILSEVDTELILGKPGKVT